MNFKARLLSSVATLALVGVVACTNKANTGAQPTDVTTPATPTGSDLNTPANSTAPAAPSAAPGATTAPGTTTAPAEGAGGGM